MFAVGENALATNFGRWIWGNQISSTKAMNAIAAVGTNLWFLLLHFKVSIYSLIEVAA